MYLGGTCEKFELLLKEEIVRITTYISKKECPIFLRLIFVTLKNGTGKFGTPKHI